MNEETAKLTLADLEKIHEELMKHSMPDTGEDFTFIVFLTTWERMVSFFSPRYALKLYADRQIREWAERRDKGVELSP